MLDVLIRRPDRRLADFVSHYWLSRDNALACHPVLPDGCVDIVVEATGCASRSWIFGTTTRRTDIPVIPGRHYLGIRFNPGKSRHFVDVPARELTDARVSAQGLRCFPIDGIAEQVAAGDVFSEIDAVLTKWLARHPPESNPTDAAIGIIETTRDSIRIGKVAATLGISRRHLARRFVEVVGVSPKLYAMVWRSRRTLRFLAKRPDVPLADVALAMGYADQSHMTRELRSLTGNTPREIPGRDVPFVQDFAL